MKALILVDLQNDFLPGGALAVPHGDEVIPFADELQRHFDLVVATKDWHPLDHGSFAANHPGKKPGDRIMLDGREQILWPVHCVQNTPGAEFAPLFDTSRIAHVFHKGVDPMMKLDIERVRLDIALGLTNTPYVMANGLSSVTPEKLQKTIDAMVSAYQLPVSPEPATVYTDRFLPPPAERMPPKGMN